jgi:hypothetical protein
VQRDLRPRDVIGAGAMEATATSPCSPRPGVRPRHGCHRDDQG